MKIIIFALAFISITYMAFCEEYEIKSRYIDLRPGDGICDAGSQMNPMTIVDSYGQEVANVHPKLMVIPGNPYLSPGSQMNPMVIETNDNYRRNQ